MLRTLCFLCTIFGAAIMAVATYKFYKLVQFTNAEAYQSHTTKTLQRVLLVMMFFFFTGYFVGAYDIFRREVEPIYLFVSVVFFVGGLFVATMIGVQTKMAASLRDKTMEVMKTLVNSIEMKDRYTKGHSQHVYRIVELFHEALPDEYRDRLSTSKLFDAALLHDIGKMSVGDEILNKRGPLTADEWEIVKSHPATGKRLLDDTCFAELGDWVLYHHERMDGRGYFNLPGDEIPLESRIIAIADTYSALTTDREYRPRTNHASALEIMARASGTQLDANLFGAFRKIPAKRLEGLHPGNDIN